MSNHPIHKVANVTVVTAIYNSVRFLRKTVESVASQTLLPYEHILVDDCSTDGSLALARQLEQEYSHVRVIVHENNKGYPSALNTAIQASNSDNIAILDSDDVAFSIWLETVMPVLENNPDVGAAGGGCIIMTEDGEITGCESYCDTKGDVTSGIRNGRYLILHPGSILRKSTLNAIGRYNPLLKSLEDSDIYIGIASISKIFNVGKPLIFYRRLTGSESRKTEEFSKLANQYISSKLKLLKEGFSVQEANKKLEPLIASLTSVTRLSPRINGAYQLEMAFAFEYGGNKKRAIKEFAAALKNGAGAKYPLRGILRCILPESLWIMLINYFRK